MRISRWAWLYYAAPCTVVWLVWLLAFWPGVMINDSIGQFRQALTGWIDDWHPAFHTMMIWAITRLRSTPASVAFVQVISLSALAGWGFALMRRAGAPRWLVWFACLTFVLSPVNGIMVITLWKDTPYSLSLLALTLLVVEIVLSAGAWLRRPGIWVLMGCTAALVALFRHNGPPAAFGALLLLIPFYRWQWRPLLAALALAIALWIGIRGPVYHLVGVQPSNIQATVLTWMITSQSQSPVGSEAPTSAADNVEQEPVNLLSRFIMLSLKNPQVFWEQSLARTASIWQITQSSQYLLNDAAVYFDDPDNPIYITPRDNELGIEQSSRWPAMTYELGKVLKTLREGFCGGLFSVWRPALYLYVFLVGVAIAVIRARNVKIGCLALPALLHTLFLLAIIPAHDVRYQYPVILVSQVLWVGLYFGNGWSRSPTVRT